MRTILLALAMVVALAAAGPVLAQGAACGGGWVLVMPTGEKDFRGDAWVTLPVKDIMRLHHWPQHDRYEITVRPVPGQGKDFHIGVIDRSSYTTILNCLRAATTLKRDLAISQFRVEAIQRDVAALAGNVDALTASVQILTASNQALRNDIQTILLYIKNGKAPAP